MDYKNLIMNLIPLYKINNRFLLGLDIDYPEDKVTDGLVIEIDINEKRIVNPPWSGQKKLKFGYYDAIEESERSFYLDIISTTLGKNMIIEIIDNLLYPDKKAIESLVWTPDRLKNNNVP